MAHKSSSFPITIRELLFIIAIFLIVFGGILGFLILFYLGIILLVALIIERFFGVVFNPNRIKEVLD